MIATAAGRAVEATTESPAGDGTMVAVVPVLDECGRLEPCLARLVAQSAALVQIVVVDGGSTDGTQALVRAVAARDARVCLVDASPVPAGWNGKAWGLASGLAASDPGATWIACIDADVRPYDHFVPSLLAHAISERLDAFSAAPLLELSGPLEALLHPAFLTTLVYRYGLPGNVARTPAQAQANGQCFVARRGLLVATQAFAVAKTSRCDDFTVARHLVAAGAAVGFYEGGRLARVRMYESAGECWANWPRSLALRDDTTSGAALSLAAAETLCVQVLPLAFAVALLARRTRTDTLFFRMNLAFALARLGVLAGTRRAYGAVGAAYWLSPLADLAAFAAVVAAAFDPAPVWRGRILVREGRST